VPARTERLGTTPCTPRLPWFCLVQSQRCPNFNIHRSRRQGSLRLLKTQFCPPMTLRPQASSYHRSMHKYASSASAVESTRPPRSPFLPSLPLGLRLTLSALDQAYDLWPDLTSILAHFSSLAAGLPGEASCLSCSQLNCRGRRGCWACRSGTESLVHWRRCPRAHRRDRARIVQ
jgi:hypothetical protein